MNNSFNYSPINASRPAFYSNDIINKNLLIVGAARNCGKTLKTDITRLQSTFKPFKKIQWLVVESDSTDDTIDKLKAIETEIKDFRFLSLGKLINEFPWRTQRIAHCRNEYINQLKSNPEYRYVDYVVVADLDGINNLVNVESFMSCWQGNDWDVCTANQRGPYYDMFALRHKVWCPNDCRQQYKFLLRHNIRAEKARFAAIYSKMIRITEDSDWIEVDSAFGGLAIYRREALESAEYSGLDDSGEEICEHVTLHSKIRSRGYRIFINPRFINGAYSEHNNYFLLLPTLKRTTKSFLKIILEAIIGVDRFNKLKGIIGEKNA